MTDNLVIAKKERAIIRESVTRVTEQISDHLKSETINGDELEEIIEHLNELSLKIKEIDSTIKKLVQESQLEAELLSAEEYREKITTWRFRANKKLRELNEKIKSGNSFSSEKESKQHLTLKESVNIKLPKLQISKFYGNQKEWLTFWSSFESSIHKNDSLDFIDKFNYLKSYLGGSALKSIEGFSMTAENYAKAVKILEDRFGQREMLVDTHMNSLLNITPLRNTNDIKSFRKIYDEILVHIRSLESLDIKLESYGNLLCPILLKMFPRELILEFNKQNQNQSYNVQEIISFLFNQLSAREKLYQSDENNSRMTPVFHPPRPDRIAGVKHSTSPFKSNNKIPTTTDLFIDSRIKSNREIICSFCDDQTHDSNFCPLARNLEFDERLNLLRKKGICFRCLKKGSHIAKYCTSKVICQKCGLKHAEIMCNQIKFTEKRVMSVKENDDKALSNQITSNCENVYLQTIIACVSGSNLKGYLRLILDTGSQKSYITKYAAETLKLEKIGLEKIRHGLFSGVEIAENHNKYRLNLSSLDKKFNCDVEILDQEKICSSVPTVKDSRLIEILQNEGIYVNDICDKTKFCLYKEDPEEIHLLIGADICAKLITKDVKYFNELGIAAIKTKLGYTLMGKMRNGNRKNVENSLSVLSLSLHVNNSTLAELWKLETIGIQNEENKERNILETETEQYFLKTVTQDNEGRYEVSLPWVVDNSILPSNRFIAEKALYKTENKLTVSNQKNAYAEIFNFWESNNIIEEVSEKDENVHFLPHRPVIKENSETTKIRPVFNASAHRKGTPSLNDCLTKGPNLIEIIPSIINKFRKHRIGISSDIEKAFLQIKITEKDRDFLRFFWFDSENNLKIFRHCRVAFGLTSSPFLLAATLNHLLSRVSPDFRETTDILKESFYIDNSLTSLSSIAETEKFIREAKMILASGHFNLRCWRSNMPNVMMDENESIPEVTPVLGLQWNLNRDSLTCKSEDTYKLTDPITKRKLLSVTQKLFDPIGFTVPVTLIPKLLIQETWIAKLKWDEELPAPIKMQLKSWLKNIHLLPEIQINRWLGLSPENENKCTLHMFADASKRAYATCAYLRIENSESTKIQLVNARNRVAPIKEMTIPRLELLSCLISARLAKTIIEDLKLDNVTTIFWCDSSTALGWIRRQQEWGTFVHNRVLEIRKLTNISDWRHVPGTMNPADLPSRGCSFEQLRKSRWWEGPSWLYLPANEWPKTEEQPDEELLNIEKRKTVLNLLDKPKVKSDWYYRYFSSYKKTVRMIAWIYRFYQNLKNAEKNFAPDISVEEIEKAECALHKLIQKESFAGIFDPNIRSLRPIEDENGILRAKTNVVQRIDKDNFRYPIILPSDHILVHRLIYDSHLENQHAGVGILMATLRENFWILKSRKCIRNVIKKCVICKRFNMQKIEVEPGIPPEDRVREASVFEIVGVDLAGPLYLSSGAKAWIVLYTCAVYRAIHLELVSSLSTETFIQSFRRFIARRGRPHVVYSDNGTNFQGTSRALSGINWNTISDVASTHKIRWKFNPPSAPWWGGWWERLVRMVKEILRKVLGRASLNYEELNTVLCDCEQVINSRPITYMSEDIGDLMPLTPLMFLQELRSAGVPDIDAIDSIDLNKRTRYKQKLRENLRKRFRCEYLGQLRQSALKNQKDYQLCVGDVVLLEDANKKRIHWPLAKIIEIYPGKDNVTRLAKVKTANGIFLRPVQRLFPLEISASEKKNFPSPKTFACSKDIPPNSNEELSDISPSSSQKVNQAAALASVPPVVTRAGRVSKPPVRLQL